MIAGAKNQTDLFRRYLQLAARRHEAGHHVLALEIALAGLRQEPPGCGSRLLGFLVNTALAPLVMDPGQDGTLRAYLDAHVDVRREAAHHVREYRKQREAERDAGRDSGGPLDGTLSRLVELLEGEMLSENRTWRRPRLPCGCVHGVVVDPATRAARALRVHLRFGRWLEFGHEPIVGQPVPGAEAALAAAREYLEAAGCEPIPKDMQVEILLEGMFQRVQGESLALAVFVAAVSAWLRIPVPEELAFTGAIVASSAYSFDSVVIPVDWIHAKLEACAQAGCTQLMVEEHLLKQQSVTQVAGCRLVPASGLEAVITDAMPQHRLPAPPRHAGYGETVGALLRLALPGRRGFPADSLDARHRGYRLLVPLFFVAMLTERWLIADYLNPEYYAGVWRAPGWLAAVLGMAAAFVLARTVYACLRLPDVLVRRGAIAPWLVVAFFMLAGHVASWLLLQVLVRDPAAPPPANMLIEHRTLQWCKDNMVLYVFAWLYFVAPHTRVRLAEHAAVAGRRHLAREILEGRRWASATLPIAAFGPLLVITVGGLAALGYLEWQTFLDTERAGADPSNGPWRAIHILLHSFLYIASSVVALWWLTRSSAWVDRLAPRD